MVQKRSRATANANTAPYRKNNPSADIRKIEPLSKERVEINRINNINGDIPLDIDGIEEDQCNLGHFVDVAKFLPELALNNNNQSNTLKNNLGSKQSGPTGKPGIPSLPDTSPNINDGTASVFPRVVVYKKPKVLWVPIPQVGTIYLVINFR